MPDSTHEAIIDAAVEVIEGLALASDADTPVAVIARMTILPLLAGGPALPAIVVSPEGIERNAGGTNRRVDTGYPLAVRIVHRAMVEQSDTLTQFLRWRQAIREALQRSELAAGYDCVYLDSPVVEADALAYDLLSSPLLFDVLARE